MTLHNILETIRADLLGRYGHDLSEDDINRVFDTVVAEHLDSAKLEEFIPVLVERDVSARLENIFLAPVLRTVEKRRNILFVNRTNRTLAEIAAALTRRAAGTAANVSVAATHPENTRDPRLTDIARQRELNLTGQQPARGRVLEAPDVTIYLNDGEEHDHDGRISVAWGLPSTNGMTTTQINDVVTTLEERVSHLVEEMGFAPSSPALTS